MKSLESPYARALQPPHKVRNSHAPHFPFKEFGSRKALNIGEPNQISLKLFSRTFPSFTGK
jgi:hypothetical protein